MRGRALGNTGLNCGVNIKWTRAVQTCGAQGSTVLVHRPGLVRGLLTFSGISYDEVKGLLGPSPLLWRQDYSCGWNNALEELVLSELLPSSDTAHLLPGNQRTALGHYPGSSLPVNLLGLGLTCGV